MKNKSGLSLIEVLISIVIFAVGILAVLRTVTHNMLTIDKVKIQTDASMLAAQGMQMMYTIRNTNIMKALPRNCALTNELQNGLLGDEFCNITFPTEASALQVSMQPTDEIDSNPYFVVEAKELADFEANMEQFRLYLHTGSITSGGPVLSWFNHDSSGTETPYARYISFESLDGGESTDHVLEMHTTVLIQKGGFTGSVVLEGVIGKILD